MKQIYKLIHWRETLSHSDELGSKIRPSIITPVRAQIAKS